MKINLFKIVGIFYISVLLSPMDSNFRNKRRYFESEEEVIDMPYLINALRVLSFKELKRLFPKASYPEYYNTFLKRRIQDIFKTYLNSQWFQDRFITNKNTCYYINPDSKVIHIKNISSSASIDDVMETIRKIMPEEHKISISQNNIDKKFTRDIYISLNDEVEIKNKYDQLTAYFDANIVEMTNMKAKDFSTVTEDQRRILFMELIKYEKPLFEIAEDNTDFSAEMFRRAFNFCLTCGRKFDCNLAMLQNCSTHTESDFCPRNIDILARPKEISQISESRDILKSYYTKTIDMNFKCHECPKTFDSTEHITNHLKNKHEEVVISKLTENNNLETFIKKIDFLIFELALGTYEKTVPSYGITNIKDDTVIYDIPCIFSGEISFE